MLYTELHKQHFTIWLPAILLFALAAIGFYFLPFAEIPKIVAPILLILLCLAMMAAAFGFYYKYAFIDATFVFDEKELTWELSHTTFIYAKQKQLTTWENIAQIARIDDKHLTSYYITWKSPDFTLILQQPFISAETDATWLQLSSISKNYNIPIHTTFYDNTPPPTGIAVLLFMMILSVFLDLTWYFHQEIAWEKGGLILFINFLALYLGIRIRLNKRS